MWPGVNPSKVRGNNDNSCFISLLVHLLNVYLHLTLSRPKISVSRHLRDAVFQMEEVICSHHTKLLEHGTIFKFSNPPNGYVSFLVQFLEIIINGRQWPFISLV